VGGMGHSQYFNGWWRRWAEGLGARTDVPWSKRRRSTSRRSLPARVSKGQGRYKETVRPRPQYTAATRGAPVPPTRPPHAVGVDAQRGDSRATCGRCR